MNTKEGKGVVLKKGILSCIIFILSLSSFADAGVVKNKDGKAVSVKAVVGDMNFEYSQPSGLSLSVAGTPFINTSSLSIVSPGWIEKYFLSISEHSIYEAVEEDYDGGKRFVLTQKSSFDPEEKFTGKQIFTLLPDNTFILEIDLQYKGEKPATFEYLVGGVNPLPIIRQSYTVYAGDDVTKGVVPLEAVGSEMKDCLIGKNFDKIAIQSRLGEIEIISNVGDDACMFDYRKNRWAEANNPYFWLGFLERPIDKNGIKLKVVFKFNRENVSEAKATKVEAKVSRKRVSDAIVGKWDQSYILPTPKSLEYTDEKFALSSRTKIYVGKDAGEVFNNGIKFLLEDLDYYYGIKPRVINQEAPANARNAIIIGDKGRYSSPADICKKAGVKVPKHAEGYSLVAGKRNVIIAANTEMGAFYGLTTLVQLVKVEKKKVYVKGAKISDYPAMDFRGVHCFSGKKAGDQIAKAVKNLMARFKINTLVWQCDFVKWDTCKEIEHKEYGMEKAEARKVAKAAKDNNIELIPLMPSLGHSEWIFTNDKNLDIAEDPETPYSYCPTNPRTYEFIFGVYQEIVDFFGPSQFHIGHDEVTMRGRFPYRSKDSGKDETELVMEDIDKLHKWFAQRDIKIGVWSDMMLWKDEASSAAFAPTLEDARKRREMLPDDVTVYDWHYELNEPEKFVSLDVFKEAGLKTVASTWSNPDNIRNFAKAANDSGAEGLLQTTWAGFNFKIDGNESGWPQYWAYILASEYAWTGENTPAADLKFNASQLFHDLWDGKKPIIENETGYLFDLTKLYNRKLADDEKLSGWLGYGDSMDLSSFPADQKVFGNTNFRVTKNARGESALLMKGNLNPDGDYPESVKIKTSSLKASKVHFLITSAFKVKEAAKIGEIVFGYSDGSQSKVDLLYGKNIFSFADARARQNTNIAWRGKSKTGKEVCVHDFCWENPYPKKKLTSITLNSETTDCSIILLGLTAVK